MKNAKNANAKSNKGVATKATKAKATPVIEVSDEVVLDAKSDITVVENTVAEGNAVCSTCKVEKEQTADNFSPSQKGGFRPICKPCQTAASLVWTTKRKDYRKDYQRAIQLINLGIPAIVPNAKDWVAGDVLMTVAYTDKNGVEIPSREAEVVYDEMKQAQANARAERKQELETQNAELKAQRAEARAEAREAREAVKAEAKEARANERAEAKVKRDAERAEKANAAKLEREQAAVERANARAEANAAKAEEARLAREKKDADREEARNQKALAKAQEIADAKLAREKAAVEKAMAATA